MDITTEMRFTHVSGIAACHPRILNSSSLLWSRTTAAYITLSTSVEYTRCSKIRDFPVSNRKYKTVKLNEMYFENYPLTIKEYDNFTFKS